MKNYFVPSYSAFLLLILLLLRISPEAHATDNLNKKPSITLAPEFKVFNTNLAPFTAQVGKHAPIQQYSISWNNLPNEIITISAPSGYEFSVSNILDTEEDGGDYRTSLSINTNALGSESHSIFVRLRDDFLPGTYSGSMTNKIESTGQNLPVPVTGTITDLPEAAKITIVGPPNLGSTEEGKVGTAIQYDVVVNNFLRKAPGIIEINAPNDFEISLAQASGFSNQISLPLTGSDIVVNNTFHFFARIKGNLPPGNYSTSLIFFNPQANRTFEIKGKVIPSTATAGVSPSTLTGFESSQDQPSIEKSFLLSATDLPTETVSEFTIGAPAGFEVSTAKEGPYQDIISVGSGIDDEDGTNDFGHLQKFIFVRLKSGLSPGLYSGDIINFNALVGNHKVAVSGKAFENFPRTLTSNPTSISALSTIQGTASGTNNFLLKAKGFLNQSQPMSITAPSEFEISQSSNGPFTQTLDFNDYDQNGDLTKNILIRIKSTTLAGNPSGNILVEILGLIAPLTIPVTGQVAPPPATSLSPGTLTFSTAAATPSPAQSFIISGTGLTISTPPIIGVTATAPADYELALSAAGPFSDNISTLAGVAADHTSSRELFIRLKGTGAGAVNRTMQVQMGSVTPSTLTLNGNVITGPPVLSVDPSSLSFASDGIAPSDSKLYKVTGQNFPTGNLSPTTAVNIAVTGPFEIHFASPDFTDGIGLLANGEHQLEVRMKAGLAPGTYTGNISHSNPAVATVNIALSGIVTPGPELTSNPLALKDFAAELGKASFAKSYIAKAANFPTTLAEETLNLDAPINFEISTDEKGPYTDKLQLPLSNGALTKTIFVRLKTTAPLGLITGNLVQKVGTLAESIVTLEGNVVQIFPVRLVSFTGKPVSEGKTFLEWQTSEETENAGFEIQKSTDAKSFSNIGWIDGQGNANQLKTYTFLDEEASTTAYYRLKQIDFDGTFTLSRIVVVVPENESVARLKAWPNPSTDGVFNVELPAAVNGTFLYDLTGKLLPAPIKTGKLDLTRYPSGLYMLKIKTKEEVRTIRLMKSN
jgi:hypothetical protein